MIYEIIDTRTGERANASALVQDPWAEKVRGCDWPALAVDETGDVMLTDDCGNYDMVPEGRVEVRLVVDREKWKPCGECKTCENCRNLEDYDPYNGSIGECGYCNNLSKFLPVNFCRECGRALTDAAWAELEKKIRGCVE